MATEDLRTRRRMDYPYFLEYRTRWSDNDQYAHMNNSIYYHLFDSIINAFLAKRCGIDPTSAPLIGLVVKSQCQFFRPVGFPQVLDLGMQVKHLGRSSVEYEVGVFEQGKDEPAAVGGYTHVFVDSKSRKSAALSADLRGGLESVRPKSKL